MGTPYLLDTNTVIDFMRGRLPPAAARLVAHIIDAEVYLSVISKIELLGFSQPESGLTELVASATVFPLSETVVNQTIKLRRLHKIKLGDAVIAATAICHRLPLLTHNCDDFTDVVGLKVQDSWEASFSSRRGE